MFGSSRDYMVCFPPECRIFNMSTEIRRWRLKYWVLKNHTVRREEYVKVLDMIKSMDGYGHYIVKMFFYDRHMKDKWLVKLPPIGKDKYLKKIHTYPYL